MNLSDLKDRVFRMTNNIYNDIFHIRDLINSALVMLSDEAKIEGKETYNIVAGTSDYALPSGYKSPRTLVDGSIDNPACIYDLITIDEVRFGYALWNGNIVIKPTPEEDRTLNFYYYKYPEELVDDNDVADPAFNGYGDAIASYAAAMILSLPGTQESSRYLIDRYFSIWEDGKKRFKADRAKANKQSTVRIVDMW